MTAWSENKAREADLADPLADGREAFLLTEGETYLVGHSLGPASRPALEAARAAAREDWAVGKVASWNDAGWIDLPKRVGAQLAPLIGAAPEDVVICDSVSVNLFKLAGAALPLARRAAIIIEEDEFPTDLYIAEATAKLCGADFVRVRPSEGASVLADEGGVLIKSAVRYRDARRALIAKTESAAAQSGGVVVWDLSHATGVVPLDLDAAGAKLAAGCTYKYLNGGPGAPSFIYARGEVADMLSTPLPGWLGHEAPFAFAPEYAPAKGAMRFVAGTPPILSLAALGGALSCFEGYTPTMLAQKAGALGDLVTEGLLALGLEVTSPLGSAERGGHVSFLHEDGYAVTRALADRGIKSDFRTPSTIRFGLSPLFLSYRQVFDVMETLRGVLEGRLYDDAAYRRRAKVT